MKRLILISKKNICLEPENFHTVTIIALTCLKMYSM